MVPIYGYKLPTFLLVSNIKKPQKPYPAPLLKTFLHRPFYGILLFLGAGYGFCGFFYTITLDNPFFPSYISTIYLLSTLPKKKE